VPTTFSLYSFADISGSIFAIKRFSNCSTAVGLLVNSTLKTSCKFDAGSVLTSSTFFPFSAKDTAVAQAVDVLPTPPLPVKNKKDVNSNFFGRKLGYMFYSFFLSYN